MKKHKRIEKCYMCDSPASSREHVPPVCLFPEKKDIEFYNFRKDLITVPSCDQHNSKKSKDDEFLMASLASIVGNNMIAYIHAKTKVKRALDRKGTSFLNALMKNATAFDIQRNDGGKYPVLYGMPDTERLYSCFLHIAHGLYYNKTGNRFDGDCNLIMDFLTYEDKQTETYKLLCKKRFEVKVNKPKVEGANPEIFKYEFFEPDELGLIGLRLTFYEGAIVFITFKKSNIEMPFDLFGSLIDSGIKTSFSFDDGEVVTFN